MIVNSARFGEVEVEQEDIFHFPQGLLGFPDEQAFILLPHQENSPFAFLQSVQEPHLAFLIVEPFVFFPEYAFEIDNEIAADLGVSADNPPQIFNIVTLPEKAEKMTANLLAPLIINAKSKKVVQVVGEKTAYTTRHLLFPDGLPQGGQ